MKKEVFFVTGNDSKFMEVSDFIECQNVSIKLKQSNVKIDEIQSLDQKRVVLHKALTVWNILKKPFLIEDSGVFFERYNQFPGVFTKFLYKGIGMEGVLKLVKEGDRAFFRLYLMYVYGESKYEIFEGICYGTVTKTHDFCSPKNFIFSNIFLPDNSEKTYAELRRGEKINPFSYRLSAVKKFLKWFFMMKKL